jgi:hypothetical protein
VVGALLLPAPDFVGTLAALAIAFIGVILLFGPWWPNKWRLNLPTDDPRIANILLSAFVAIYAFHRAWNAYVDPEYEFVRLDRTIVALLGRDGVAAFWIVIACGCLGATITLYRKGRNAA